MCICIISHIAARELAQLASFWQWNVKHAYNLRRGYYELYPIGKRRITPVSFVIQSDVALYSQVQYKKCFHVFVFSFWTL